MALYKSDRMWSIIVRSELENIFFFVVTCLVPSDYFSVHHWTLSLLCYVLKLLLQLQIAAKIVR